MIAEMDELVCCTWLWMASCLLLGVELLYRRCHWCYVCLYLFIAIFSFNSGEGPRVTALIHYILAVYVCVVFWIIYCYRCHRSIATSSADQEYNANVQSINMPLHVGERISAEEDTLKKWIVAIKIPAQETIESHYVVVKPTSGKMFHKTRHSEQYINDNYHLDHVGWYGKSSILEIPQNEHGNLDNNSATNTRYEVAANTALLVANTKVYTYFKCMMLYRLDTLLMYLCLPCSLISLPLVSASYKLSSLVPLFTAIINLIALIEVSMLQPGKRFAFIKSISYFCSTITEDLKKLDDYFQENMRCIQILSFGICIGIGITIMYYQPDHMHDYITHIASLEKNKPEAAGPEVVDTVVTQIENAKIFESDHMHDYIRRIARVESKDGLDDTTYREGYHGGIWQVDEDMFLVTKNTSYPILVEKHKLIKKQFNTDWMSIQWKDLRIPLWSGMAAYLYMCTVNEEIPSSVSEQADHWNRNYNSKKKSPRKPEEFVIKVKELEMNITECYRDVDLFIVLDSSGSIAEEKYEIAKKFVVDFVSGFTISKHNVRVGLIIYSNKVKPIFYLGDSFNQTAILNKIRRIPYLNLSTATGDAIKLMVETGFTEARGARPPELAIPRVGVVLTDGATNHGVRVHMAAQAARDKSIEMFAFGIGDGIYDQELLEIAGSQERKFKINSFNNINDARALIARKVCKAGIKASIDMIYKDSLDSGKRRLLEYTIPKEGITVEVHVTKGKITLYGSHDNRDPSPVWHDYVFSDIHGHRKILILHPKKHDEPTIPFYCNLVGVENSAFSIKGMNGIH